MRILVIGSRGQLGAVLVRECSPHHDVVALDRSALDVTNPAAVLSAVTDTRPDAIVNCTGYNAVDLAEEQPVAALAVNGLALRSMARAASAAGATLLHYSTDFVFDGLATAPMKESAPTNPRSVYAVSKLIGEWFALEAPVAYVLRVESLFGEAPGVAPKGTVAAIIGALRQGRSPRVFSDRTVSPTFVPDAARATRLLLERRPAAGIYHCVNSGQATWLEFAAEAARLLGVSPVFDVVRFADVRLPAARPQYCALSNEKLLATGIPMPSWQDALARYLRA
jgi:dTDP-4-dehydrorhamnose reductase